MKIVILGAGGHAGVIIDLLRSLADVNSPMELELLDDNLPEETLAFGIKVAGKITRCLEYPASTKFVIGIGNNQIRKEISQKYDLEYISLIHPSATVGNDIEIKEGSVIMAGAVINTASHIGKHCIINTGATVDHNSDIDDFVHISPGVHMGGNVRIGKNCWLGLGSSIKNGVTICDNVTVGVGSVVIKDIIEPGTYFGVPVTQRTKIK